ncbi:MAG TPA: amino acid adenylation domain-containing protein, partial [Pyrinomonadaceae bacterium]|nr:amino acid adenylation domain-containing protein [Pyrinomonadaceae bacterium]
RQLVDCPTALELPSDFPRQAQQTFAGAALRIDLAPELCNALRTLSRHENATLFMTLFAAFVTLLHRYTGDEDISVGSGVGNRCWREVEGLVGMFVNTLVMRTDVSGDPTYRELLARVREVTLAAYSHQSVPFNQVVEVLQPDRDLSRNPLFQVAFSFHDAPRPSLALPGLKIGVTEALNNGSAKFDLNIIVIPRPLPKEPGAPETVNDGMTMIWEYNRGLFTAQTLASMVQHYQRLLEAIVVAPQERVAKLPMLSEAECQELLVAHNQTESEYPRDASVAQLFEKQAALTPEAPAIVAGTQVLSYRELNEKANQLARYLRSRGHGFEQRESLVGVMLRRSPNLVVSLLAVLKAGAAYLPLDADDPAERLRYMVSDARVTAVLTESDLLEKLGDSVDGFCLDLDAAQIAILDRSNLDTASDGDSLAYAMYTSGSTGRPKGILIEQHSVSRLVINTDFVQLTAADRVAHVSNVSFDAATFEIWGALLNGAALVVIDKDVALSPHEFATELQQQQISTIFLTTALFNQLASTVTGAFDSLKQVLLGGEAVDPRWVREVLKHGPPERLLHVYGPTETTTFASWQLVKSVPADASNIPIGKPLANTRLYVLDEQLQTVPSGVPGELYIGGDGVGRGYLNQPELTAARFIVDPFVARPQRMYRTGDVVRWLPDGTLEFLRRKDQQVKLRGHRIEPGEIENILSEHEAVRESVVILREDQPGEKRLVAYLVNADSAESVSAAELRSYLKQRLPDYMVPANFVWLQSLPLTPNGKIAIAQLPPPGTESEDLETGEAGPRSATEELLAGIYAAVLHRSTVGVRDDFFALGGHSLLATQVVSRIRECFHIELPLRALFAEPTIAGLSRLVEAARGKKTSQQAGPIVPVGPQDELPLSFAQQRLWFLDQLEPHNTAYNIAALFRLDGAVDTAAVTRSLQTIIQRHEVLRTSFPVKSGRPTQVIAPVDPFFTVPYEDFTHLTPTGFENELQRRLKKEAETPFDLSRGPLFRVTLLAQSADRHALLVTLHHIIGDGWSLNLFRKEFATLYRAYLNGQSAALRPLSIQYSDYAVWQREWFQNGAIEKQLSYWREQLKDLTTLHLPTDHLRPAVQTFKGRRVVTLLSAKLSKEVKQVSQQEGATLFMTLLAAFAVLLSRYSGQNDITVGSPIAGRDRRELEDLIGFFVNTLVLRVDLSGDLSFRELLSKVRDVTLDAYANQELPFERLVEELNQPRDLSRSPVFQVLFSLLNLPAPQLDSAGLHLSELEAYSDVAKFDLSLTAKEVGEQLELAFQYNTDLFAEETIKRMVQHYERLLAAIVNDSGQALLQLPLLSEEERQQQLREWNETATEYPRHSCIHRLFEAEAERRPQAIALEFGSEQLSYGDLNARANQLAHYLSQLGVGAETPVGVMLPRSIDLIVALLGVLKAGGAYVPLDLEYPAERLRYMMGDAGLRVLITDGTGLERVAEISGTIVRLDEELESIRQASTDNLAIESSAESLAYIMYTSGSMGLPKGICIEHRGVVRLVRNTNYVTLTEDEVLLQFAPVSFDASTFEIWGALLNGGRLVLAQNERTSLTELGTLLQQYKITTLWLTAGLFHLMVDEQLDSLRGVRQILAGGDVLSVRQVKRVLAELPACKLINGYGPTENTTFTCCHVMDHAGRLGASVPIGKPIANTHVYVLDKRQEPVPLGVAGELYVGGDGVARGYLNQPELTVSRFLKDWFRDEPGGRLYRTGDIVRWQPSGVLEFIGRDDDQVKLRGYRIELREVETALSLHEGVSKCLVLLRVDEAGDKQLVAYVVSKPKDAASAGELRAFLKQRLPDYMIPAAFVLLEQLPLTANGKVDVALLPPPEVEGERDSGAVLTPTEELLVNIYAAVLNRGSVNLSDDFFALGGHSLLATQVVSRIRECFHVELPLRTLFAEPTIAGLSPLVEAARQHEPSARTRPIDRTERRGELPLSFAQQRLWFLDQLEPQNTAYNITGALRLSGPLNVAAVTRSVDALFERHEVLRTSFPVSNGRPIQHVAEADYRIALAQEQLSGLTTAGFAEEITQVLSEETQEPFDLATGPLMRVRLLSLSPNEHALVFTLHHIVSDGWSLRILFQEFAAFYNAALTNAPCALPDLPVQYGDYSVWQRDWLNADEMEEKLDYWREHLAGLSTVQLPTDRVRPPLQTFRGGRVATTLAKTVTAQLHELNRREGVTLFMSLLSAFAVL